MSTVHKGVRFLRLKQSTESKFYMPVWISKAHACYLHQVQPQWTRVSSITDTGVHWVLRVSSRFTLQDITASLPSELHK